MPSGSIARTSALPPPARCTEVSTEAANSASAGVQEDRADLKRSEHPRAVGLEKHVVGQVVDLVEVHQPAHRELAVEPARPLESPP